MALARRDPLDALDRGGRDEREPEAAVAREVLLRGEVVDVGLRRVEVDAAGGARRVDDRERAGVAGTRVTGAITPVEVSLCGQA